MKITNMPAEIILNIVKILKYSEVKKLQITNRFFNYNLKYIWSTLIRLKYSQKLTSNNLINSEEIFKIMESVEEYARRKNNEKYISSSLTRHSTYINRIYDTPKSKGYNEVIEYILLLLPKYTREFDYTLDYDAVIEGASLAGEKAAEEMIRELII